MSVIRARRITCHEYEPGHDGSRDILSSSSRASSRVPGRVSHLASCSLTTCIGVTKWLLAHCSSILLMMLVLASGINLPVIVAAASSAGAATSAATSSSSSSPVDSSTGGTIHPHILLVSIPWRGHMFPLIHLGQRLLARGFHVSFAVASRDAESLLSGTGITALSGGRACHRIKRQPERQPTFPTMANEVFNSTLHSVIHPGAQLVDLFASPTFQFQQVDPLDLNHTATSDVAGDDGPSPSFASNVDRPNGINLLMNTFAEFQSCMYPTLSHTIQQIMKPEYYDTLTDETQHQSKKGVKKNAKKAASTFGLRTGPPSLMIVDRFTFAGLDVAREFGIKYVVNNPHLLLDLDSPSWALPAPWSYLPHGPPLSLFDRLSNLAHRFNYRATMQRALARINHNRAVNQLTPLDSWEDYFSSVVILTNTIFGVELHRSADSQGMQSHRNVNVFTNGFTPRFKMTGPLLPVGVSTNRNAHVGGVDPLHPPMPYYPNGTISASLIKFIEYQTKELSRRIIYVNLGDGSDLTKHDVDELLHALQTFSSQFCVIWSLPHKFQTLLMPDLSTSSSSSSSWLHVTPFVSQFPFLIEFHSQIVFVMTHGSLSNIQEILGAGLPILLLPHPYVEQYEVAKRFVQTKAILVIQRVQLEQRNIIQAIKKMTKDESQGTIAACSLIELIHAIGWSHLIPITDNRANPLPFYRDFLSLPIDIYAIYVVAISLLVFLCKQMWSLFINVWSGDKKW